MRGFKIAIIDCALFDGTGAPLRKHAGVVIEDGKFTQVGDASAIRISKDTKVIKGVGKTVIPGLMDIHVHLASPYYPPETNPMLGKGRTPQTLAMLYAAKHAKDLVEAGFTTVRDVGNNPDCHNAIAMSLKRGIDYGLIPGPRIFAAGCVSMTAGHFDMGNPQWLRRPENVADGVWEVRKRVRELIATGVDLIKITGSGGMSGELEEMWWRNYTLEEIQAITDEAHALGRRVAAHVYTPEPIKTCIRGGVDTIEHGFPMDAEAIRMMKKYDRFLVPTLHVFSERTIKAIEGKVHDHMFKKIQRAADDNRESFKRAYKAGVKIASGSDITIVSPPAPQHGDNAYELELMVRYGMSEGGAIVASTKMAAIALGKADVLGTIEEGKKADLLMLNGNPLDDIKLLQDRPRIELVMKDGGFAVDRNGITGRV